MQQKELKRQHIKRKPLEAKLRALKSITVREILYVLNCGEEKANIIQDILNLRLKNRNILHAWLKNGDVRATQPWNGRIMKQSGSVSHVVCYWSSDETFENGIDYIVNSVHLAADYLNTGFILL